jgi:uncharacterized protein YneF (UPF0154 family)
MKMRKWILIVVLALIAVLVIGGYLLSPKIGKDFEGGLANLKAAAEKP